MPIFVVYVLEEGVDKLGIVIAIATFVSYAFRILFGYLSDRFQIVMPFVVAGYFISALSKPLLAYANGYSGVGLLRGVQRMGKSIRSASKDSLISGYVKNKEHGETFGFHKSMDIAGELAGALIVLLIFTFIALAFMKDAPKTPKRERSVINEEDYKLFPILFIYFGFRFFIMSERIFFGEHSYFRNRPNRGANRV